MAFILNNAPASKSDASIFPVVSSAGPTVKTQFAPSLTSVSLSRYNTFSTGSMAALFSKWVTIISHYTIENDIKVHHFIMHHPGIEDMLTEAPERIAEYFGEVKLSLSVEHVLETDSSDLIVHIGTKLVANEAIEAMDEFYRAWWRAQSKSLRRNIVLTPEFI